MFVKSILHSTKKIDRDEHNMAIEVKPTVRLMSYTPDPDKLVATSAMVCYADNIEEIHVDGNTKIIDRLKSMGHMSPFEHASFTFLIDGISRTCSHQLVRHRIASYSQRSQRYVTEAALRYIVPDGLRGKKCSLNGSQVDAEEYFKDVMGKAEDAYNTINKALGDIGEKSNEIARSLLPNATATTIMVTMNARSLFNFFSERLCMRAQGEIRDIANMMLNLVKDVAPKIFSGVGPKCVMTGECPERKPCGKFANMVVTYGDDAYGK